jgi:hypothetical protein
MSATRIQSAIPDNPCGRKRENNPLCHPKTASLERQHVVSGVQEGGRRHLDLRPPERIPKTQPGAKLFSRRLFPTGAVSCLTISKLHSPNCPRFRLLLAYQSTTSQPAKRFLIVSPIPQLGQGLNWAFHRTPSIHSWGIRHNCPPHSLIRRPSRLLPRYHRAIKRPRTVPRFSVNI